MRISDWSSDVCSSDLRLRIELRRRGVIVRIGDPLVGQPGDRLGIGEGGPLALIEQRRFPPAGDIVDLALGCAVLGRSEERRVGKECVRTCRSRWSPYN